MRDRLCHWLFLLAPVAVLFAPVVWGERLLAFRDGGHFHFPLLAWLDSEHLAGNFPLWNPYDGLGAPVAGDSTAALFYPGRIVFWLPGSIVFRYHVYVIGHLAGCALGAGWLARRWECSKQASILAALAYAFSGSLLFQVFNVIFLAGAAWLPLALAGGWDLARGRFASGLRFAAPALAMMVLGGDPQMAVHASMAIVIFGCTAPSATWRERAGHIAKTTAMLVIVVAAASALAAAQVVPTVEATRASARSFHDRPRSLWQAIGICHTAKGRESALAGLLGPVHEGTVDHSVYQFSVPPWRAIELVWPNPSGDYFPASRRWLSAVEGEGRVWAPRLYGGLLPLALWGLAIWGGGRGWFAGDGPWKCLMGLAIFAWVASWGWYAPGTLVKCAARWLGCGDLPWLGDQVGSVVWGLGLLLPGYSSFRYPAKWLVFGALPMALVAARAWDALDDPARRRGRIGLVGLAIFSTAGLAGSIMTRGAWWQPWADTLPGNPVFGPFDGDGAWRSVFQTLLHTAVVAALLAGTLAPSRAAETSCIWFFSSWKPSLALLITAIELVVAHRSSIPMVPTANLISPTFAMRGDAATPLRVQRATDISETPPPRWREASSPARLDELAAWEWITLAGKTHLRGRVANLDAQQTLPRADFTTLLREYRFTSLARSGLGPLGVEGLIASRAALPPANSPWEPLPDDALAARGDAVYFRHRAPAPRAWATTTVVRRGSQHPRTLAELRRITRETVQTRAAPSADGKARSSWRDLIAFPIVETDAPLANGMTAHEWSVEGPPETLVADDGTPLAANDRQLVPATILSYGLHEVLVETELAKPGLLVLSDQFAPGWTAARFSPNDRSPGDNAMITCDIVRTNRVLRGVPLPAGHHRVVFRYRSTSQAIAIGVSLIAWAVYAGIAVAACWRGRPSSGSGD